VRILRLKADGFGALRGEIPFATDRLNLVVDENERGKSTLLAAVCAALYGLDDNRNRHRLVTPLERWRPWSGGPYRVELEVERRGERLVITRDFEAGTIAVWNDRGQEVTDRFREGRDEYPVGNQLVGLNVDQFRKCCYWRQGELEDVIPGDEPERRHATLRSLLENAADTRVGDTSATDAIQALDQAAASYTCAELDSTRRLDTALSRLEAKRETLEIERARLEHELEQMAPRLERLAALTEEEQRAQRALSDLEIERRAARVLSARRRIDEDASRRADLGRMRDEAVRLIPFAHVPPDVESRFGELLARRDETIARRDDLERKRLEAESERERMRAEVEALEAYARFTEEDASALASHAARIRVLDNQHQELRVELNRSRETATQRGLELERFEELSAAFESLVVERVQLIESQPILELRFQSEITEIEQARSASYETLRRIESARHRRRLPGWAGLASGLVLAGVALAIGGRGSDLPWVEVASGGAALALAGLILLASAARHRRTHREEANDRLEEADQASERLRTIRTENHARIQTLALKLGYSGPAALLMDWDEYQRMLEASGPYQSIGQQLASLEKQRELILAEAEQALEPMGGGPVEPTLLDLTAACIRQRLSTLGRLADFDRNWAWLDHDQSDARSALAEIEASGARVLESAGLPHDPARGWDEQRVDLVDRVRSRNRHEVLTRDLIPEAERALADADTLAALRDEIAVFESDPARADAIDRLGTARSTVEIEAEIERARAEQETRRHERNELRIEYEQRSREHRGRLTALRAESEAVERALSRAGRFKAALALARATIEEVALDTHRRWADHLNHRVTEIVKRIGVGIEQVRFGEDLDFAVKLVDGPRIARGKAMHQLSSGARDQLHLAVRLAIGEFLSRDLGSLPLLVDDSFATSDDERARAGMRILIEHFAVEHQVIVVTCQRARHETLAALDRELYEARVHRLETRLAAAK
jgi:hypothetical protein